MNTFPRKAKTDFFSSDRYIIYFGEAETAVTLGEGVGGMSSGSSKITPELAIYQGGGANICIFLLQTSALGFVAFHSELGLVAFLSSHTLSTIEHCAFIVDMNINHV